MYTRLTVDPYGIYERTMAVLVMEFSWAGSGSARPAAANKRAARRRLPADEKYRRRKNADRASSGDRVPARAVSMFMESAYAALVRE
ncbi:hypothetical protein EVAR_2950_1 [Eumeta japonica]|uniref:Uncharacterized protein n=1 Tax=Eumeta variegata TaxID=151549 RepID=A0A4C1T3Y9_EUMVA|nr:hypothetical protein EVAR_2950_1 [Eumeta japonica]